MTEVPAVAAPIIVLARDAPSSRAVVNALARAFPDVSVIYERPVRTRTMIGRRVRTLGPVTVIGQILFLTVVVPFLRRRGAGRVAEICRAGGLDVGAVDVPVERVDSANDPIVGGMLRTRQPAVLVVNGTRILTGGTLGAVDAPIVNMHAGITPLYRGSHGGYWALADGRPDLVGTTIHLVDAGIDTGPIVEQAFFTVHPADSFATYPYLHLSAGIPALIRAVRAAIEGELVPHPGPPSLPTRLRTHPTIWGYLGMRLTRGVR